MLDLMLSTNKADYSLKILTPHYDLLPNYEPNGLITVEYPEKQAGLVKPAVNAYLSNCGPNTSISFRHSELTEKLVREVIRGSPAGYGHTSNFSISVSGDSATVFFNAVK